MIYRLVVLLQSLLCWIACWLIVNFWVWRWVGIRGLASYPGHEGGEKAAWYQLHVHASTLSWSCHGNRMRMKYLQNRMPIRLAKPKSKLPPIGTIVETSKITLLYPFGDQADTFTLINQLIASFSLLALTNEGEGASNNLCTLREWWSCSIIFRHVGNTLNHRIWYYFLVCLNDME